MSNQLFATTVAFSRIAGRALDPAGGPHRGRVLRGFTLIESLLVLAVIGMLAALIWPGLASARRSARATHCAANLRQIAMAYQMYEADYGRLPNSQQALRGGYFPDRRILACPDEGTPLSGSPSSYSLRLQLPPDFARIDQQTSIDPATVLVDCPHHSSRPLPITDGLPPPTGFYMVLRASGAVNRVPVEQIRQFHLPGPRLRSMLAFPREPGYDRAGQ